MAKSFANGEPGGRLLGRVQLALTTGKKTGVVPEGTTKKHVDEVNRRLKGQSLEVKGGKFVLKKGK
jgi:hypothetical protein